MKTISPDQAARLMEQGAVLVDIREPGEVARLRIPGAVLLPLSQLGSPEPELPRGGKVMFICASGGRTGMYAGQLAARAQGSEAHVVAGGIAAWRAAGLPLDGAQPGAGGGFPTRFFGLMVLAGAAVAAAVTLLRG